MFILLFRSSAESGGTMKVQPVVRTETKKMAVGVAGMSAVMLFIFLLLGRLDYTVVLGALLGAGAAVLNYFLMALTIQINAESMAGVQLPPEDENEEEKGEKKELSPESKAAKKRSQFSYTYRMLMLAVICILGAVVSCFNIWATVIPLLFPRIVISIEGFLMNRKKEADPK